MLSFLGILAFLMAALDATCRLLDWPLTAFAWSPLLFVAIGFMLIALEALGPGTSPSHQAD